MEKVKVTREQINIINSELDKPGGENYLFCKHARIKCRDGNSWIYQWECLNKLSIEEMAQILYKPNGYEVEEEFKVGDWVVHKLAGDVAKVTQADSTSIHCDNGMGGYIKGFRHATDEEITQEKERRWWSKHGREFQQVKNGDIIKKKSDGFSFDVAVYGEQYVNSNWNLYEIICFKENRLDGDSVE